MGYEIDKCRARFVKVGVQADEDSTDESESSGSEEPDSAFQLAEYIWQSVENCAETRRNDKERYSVSRLAAADSKPQRDADRRHIVLLLKDSIKEAQSGYSRPLSVHERKNYTSKKDNSQWPRIALHGPVCSFPVKSVTMTAAISDRGHPFLRIQATSGWAPTLSP